MRGKMDAAKAHSLRVMRLFSGSTYIELAEAYGISVSYVGRILAGRVYPEDTRDMCHDLSEQLAQEGTIDAL